MIWGLSPADLGTFIGGLAAGAATIVSLYFKGVPWAREKLIKRRETAVVQHAIRDVIIGRDAGAANPITGEIGQPALPGISERINSVAGDLHDLKESQEFQIGKLHEIERFVKSSTEERIQRLEDVVTENASRVALILKILKPDIVANLKQFENVKEDEHENYDH